MANDRPMSPGNDSLVGTISALLILISISVALLWYFFSPYIAWATVQTTLFVKPLLLPFTFLMSEPFSDFLVNMESKLAQNFRYEEVTISEVLFLQNIAFRAISVVLIPLLLWRGFSNVIFAKKYGFTRKLSILDLAEIQASRYPRVKPAIKAKLLEQDQRFGPWATSRNPLPYLIVNNLVTATHDSDLESCGIPQFNDLNIEEKHNQLMEYHGSLLLDVAGITKLLQAQLGPKCVYTPNQLIDINQLPQIDRAMAILFLSARTKDREIRKRINELLDQFGDSFIEGKPATETSPAIPHKIDLSGIDELWSDTREHHSVKRALLSISKTHAYWSTAFTAMFQFIYDEFRNLKARDFIFLKPVNRTLYLSCSQVGLEASRAETCAIRAHYIAEKKLNSPIIEPFISGVKYELIEHIQSEGWLSEDIVANSFEEELSNLNISYEKNLAEFNKNPIDAPTFNSKETAHER